MHKFYNIPEELRNLNQWIVWRYEDIGAKKPTKVPYNPNNSEMANVNAPHTWGSFDVAMRAYNTGDYSGIGFVFCDFDPYTFLDLDDTLGDQVAMARQIQIFKEFDSYSEVSPSGMGLHIIVKGKVPAGRRRSFIEIYSSQRYATFTGQVHLNKPIVERQDMLTQLWEQMGHGGAATYIYKGDDIEKETDATIITNAASAVNGDKFKKLYSGGWQDLYQSQSEADFALIDIIAFYTQNRNQITRIFQTSELGKREKAKRKDYLLWMINKSFDCMLPQIDMDGFTNIIQAKVAEKQIELPIDLPIQPKPSPALTIPPGMLGELAQFIYQSAPRPVPEIALAGAIGLMAGICGRAYNISNTGLNQYILLLAKTGMGKEGMAAGIDKLMNAVKQQVPTCNNFIGPSHIASGQALVKYVHKKSQCFVSILGEFGLRVQSMSNPNANPAEKMLKQILLEIYNKSGHTDTYRASIYADNDKNTEATNSPSFSILGESTPHSFYSALNEDMITEGLLPRFMLIEYNGIRPDLNKNHSSVYPPNWLTDKLASLTASVETIMHTKRHIDVRMTDDAEVIASHFDKLATNKINSTTNEVTLNLWNRAHLKALKLAALIAVGVNYIDPVVTPEYINWAINMVETDIKSLSAKFEDGEVGLSSSETKQNKEIIRIMMEFVTRDWGSVAKYCQGKNIEALYNAKIIPYSYLSKKLLPTSAFRLDRQGPTQALKRAIQISLDSDNIREVGKSELTTKFGTSQRAFMISNIKLLD